MPPPPPPGWQAPRPAWQATPPRPPGGGRRWPTSRLVLAAGLAFLAGLLIGAVAVAAGNRDDDVTAPQLILPTTTTSITSTTSTTEDAPTTTAGSDIRTFSGNQAHPPQADVGSLECTRNQFGDLEATATVTNHSSERSNYVVTVAFESPDGKTQLASSGGFVQDLEPGQSAPLRVVTGTDAPAEFTCRLTEVERFASL